MAPAQQRESLVKLTGKGETLPAASSLQSAAGDLTQHGSGLSTFSLKEPFFTETSRKPALSGGRGQWWMGGAGAHTCPTAATCTSQLGECAVWAPVHLRGDRPV